MEFLDIDHGHQVVGANSRILQRACSFINSLVADVLAAMSENMFVLEASFHAAQEGLPLAVINQSCLQFADSTKFAFRFGQVGSKRDRIVLDASRDACLEIEFLTIFWQMRRPEFLESSCTWGASSRHHHQGPWLFDPLRLLQWLSFCPMEMCSRGTRFPLPAGPPNTRNTVSLYVLPNVRPA